MSFRALATLATLMTVWTSGVRAAEDWNAIVAAAEREGSVNVHGGPGSAQAQALTAFKSAYPKIEVKFVGAAGRDAIPVITRERAAGVYQWDVYVGGTPSILQTLKPAGAFAPLRPAIDWPDIVSDDLWFGGFDGGWMDAEKSTTFGFSLTMNPVVSVNWEFVSPDELKTFADLLNPRFADKIVFDDPRRPGQGQVNAQALLINFGPDFLRDLFSKQKITYSTNSRQAAEWLVRGRYPISIAPASDQILPFREQGLGRRIAVFNGDMKTAIAGPGFGTVSLMDRAPHPNAARVYLRWLLSPAGQKAWTENTKSNSRRLDVPRPQPDLYPAPGTAYVDPQSEKQIPAQLQAETLAREHIKAQ
jgi:iron(III) transport system substrate-binding protein